MGQRRKGRGSRNVEPFFSNTLLPRSQLLIGAASASSISNLKRARKLFPLFARNHGASDPSSVSNSSSELVLNFLYEYCKIGTDAVLKNDAMGAMIQGLRMLYEENGHIESWRVHPSSERASGNPLTNNHDITLLRRSHRVILAKHGDMSIKVRPITAAIVCSHAEMFWLGGEQPALLCDIQLHSILVLGLHLGLRFDEIYKLRVEHVSTDGIDHNLTIRTTIKNSTEERVYWLREWPGNSEIRISPYLDPVVALYSWLTVRGSESGPLFCSISDTRGGQVLGTAKELSSAKFYTLLRDRLETIGIGKSDVLMYSGHFIKRGAVQLYRSLNIRDEQIMEIIQMKGSHAYANYCSAYNDCAPPCLPRFSSWNDFVKHAETIDEEQGLLHDQKKYEEFMLEVFGSNDSEDD